jgi:hypothetical protein
MAQVILVVALAGVPARAGWDGGVGWVGAGVVMGWLPFCRWSGGPRLHSRSMCANVRP